MMNCEQIAKQLVYLLAASSLFGSSSSIVRAAAGSASALSASISAVELFLASGLTFPIAAIETLATDHDEELAGLQPEARFRISIAGQALTEQQASFYVGSGGVTSGLDVLAQTIRNLIAYLNGGDLVDSTHGFQGRIEIVGSPRLVVVPGKTHAVGECNVLAFNVRDAAFYHQARRFKGVAAGGGGVTLTWVQPPTRFDLDGVVIRRAAGATAPTSVSGGMGVITTPSLLSTFLDSPGAGQWSYAIFGAYGTNYSAPATSTVTAT